MLVRGDSGQRVMELQRSLNKIGSLLRIDGDFGPVTEAAVRDARVALSMPGAPEADDVLEAALAALTEPSEDIGAAGVTFIAREEVSGPQDYRRLYSHPIWPTPSSGITIGIGYDLSAVTQNQFAADWGSSLPPEDLTVLSAVVGLAGTKKRLERVAHVTIGLPLAMQVFLRRMLPDHVPKARQVFPFFDALERPRRTALVSLIFNRGPRMTGPDRVEMRNIRDLLHAGRHDAVADQFDAMVRLWNPKVELGVIARRHHEGTLWRSGFEALQLA
jgi:hypothetical protein